MTEFVIFPYSNRNEDVLKVMKKARTRALKRKATDESEVSQTKGKKGKKGKKKSSSSSSSPSFSSESSGEDEDDASVRRSKAKAKAKLTKEEKEKKKVKTAAAAVMDKIDPILKAFRASLAHECVDDLDPEYSDPVKTWAKALRAVWMSARESSKTGVDAYTQAWADFDMKAAKKAKSDLDKRLKKAKVATS